KHRKSAVGSAVELILIVATALGLALAIQAFIIKPYRIPSGSMLPTIRLGQRVLVDRLGDDFSSPHVGEIIVFHPPKNYDLGCLDTSEGQTGGAGQSPCGVPRAEESSETFIKRVVGLPGDRIAIKNGHVYRNGVREHDAYIAGCAGQASCNFPVPITVPHGDYYMMGDNRGESDDSRFWGPVPRSWIIGDAFFTYWPPDRIGTL
ncbi:MAG TPA: signal peptidase I, partial [Solirubrobacteraceae bacterium]